MSNVLQWNKLGRSTSLLGVYPVCVFGGLLPSPFVSVSLYEQRRLAQGMWTFYRAVIGLLIFLLDLSSPDATYPISAATQLMFHTEHAGSADITREPLPDGTFYVHMNLHRGFDASMIS